MKLIFKLKPLMSIVFITTILAIVGIASSQAADFNVTCNASGCTSPGSATFNETSVAPGDSITKYIQVKNNHNETLNLDMTTSKENNTDDIFLDVVDVVVIGLGGRVRFNNTLRQFLTSPTIDLGSINDSGQEKVKIILTLRDVGNQYQGKQAIFDLPIHINVQGQGGTSDSSAGEASVIGSPSPSPFQAGIVAGAVVSPEPGVLGESTPSAQTKDEAQTPGSVLGQVKSLFKWWPWLFLLGPLFWWFHLLYKRRRNR